MKDAVVVLLDLEFKPDVTLWKKTMDEINDSELARLKFELAEASTPIALKAPMVWKLIARLDRLEAEALNPAHRTLRLSQERDSAVVRDCASRDRAKHLQKVTHAQILAVDSQLDSILKYSRMYGDPPEVEAQVLLLLDVRRMLSDWEGFQAEPRFILETFVKFVSDIRLADGSKVRQPLYTRNLPEAEFVAHLSDFRKSLKQPMVPSEDQAAEARFDKIVAKKHEGDLKTALKGKDIALCIGWPTIEKLRTEGQAEFDCGVTLVAASDLFRSPDYPAVCAEMRDVLTVCGTEQLVSVDGSRIDHALSSDAGKDYVRLGPVSVQQSGLGDGFTISMSGVVLAKGKGLHEP